jgi:hypothetical protein
VSVQARNTAAVLREIARAKARFGVAERLSKGSDPINGFK